MSATIQDVTARAALLWTTNEWGGVDFRQAGDRGPVVRVTVEDGELRAYRFVANEVLDYEVRFSAGTPSAVLVAAVRAMLDEVGP